jgi:hypothetical protein
MAYIPALKGFITDVPEIWLKRKDDRVFHYNKLTSSNVTPNTNFTEVTGGWGLYPIAYLPGASTMEMTFESAEFDGELFSMANATDFIEDATGEESEVWGNVEFEVEGEGSATTTDEVDIYLPLQPPAGTKYYINGLSEQPADDSGELEAGEFKVGTFSQDGKRYKATITFGTALDVGSVLVVNYVYTKKLLTAKINNQRTFVGSAMLRWPVYSAGNEVDAAEVKGYFLMKIYRCRVTQFPGFDASLDNRLLVQQCA